MPRRTLPFWVLGVVVFALSVGLPSAATAQGGPGIAPRQPHIVRACDAPAPRGGARCHAQRRDDLDGLRPEVAGPAAGAYGPLDLHAAYSLGALPAPVPPATTPAWTWNNQTVAIVDAYDDPSVESDLAGYRGNYGLPSCTSSNGCFTKVNQSGQALPLPVGNTGWAEEISLDVDMVSAICPECKILLVEASSNSYANLGAAVDEAAKLGANAISNSYGGGEFNGETSYDSDYNHPGIAVTASSGDNGYEVEYPAASQYVTAVGGTSLSRNSSVTRGWSETAWSGAGSGCSAYETQPTWQATLFKSWGLGCTKRMVADVSADADPNTGVAVYDTYGLSGWAVFGGTSVASPITASVYALGGNTAPGNSNIAPASFPYSNGNPVWSGAGETFNDVTSGSNGSCGGTYLCTSKVGYDGPTGNGTPESIGGFMAAPSYSLSASPAVVSVTPGGAGVSSTITLSVSDNYTYAVNLAVASLPTGITASPPNPASVSAASPTSTLTVDAAAGVAAGTYQVTVTGTGTDPNSLSRNATVTVQVPDYSLAASPSSLTVVAGGTAATSSITLTALGGYNNPVTLSATQPAGNPPGIITSFNPSTPVTPTPGGATTILSVKAGSSVPAGTAYGVTVIGTDGNGLTHSATVNLTVSVQPNFSMAPNPATLKVYRSTQRSAGTTITLTSLNGFSGAVSLRASGLPNRTNDSFSSNPVTLSSDGSGTSTLMLTVSNRTPTGSYTITVSGTGPGGTPSNTTTVTLVVGN